MGLGVSLRTAGCWFGAGVPLGFALGLVMLSCLLGTLVVDGGRPLLGLFLPGQIKGVEMKPNEDLELRELEDPTRGWTGSGGPGGSGVSGLGLGPGSSGGKLGGREDFPSGTVVPVVLATFRGPGTSLGLLLDPDEPRTRPGLGIWPLAVIGPAHITQMRERSWLKKCNN